MLIFVINNPNLTTQSVSYDPQTHTVAIKSEYSNDLFDKTLNITFNPSMGFSL